MRIPFIVKTVGAGIGALLSLGPVSAPVVSAVAPVAAKVAAAQPGQSAAPANQDRRQDRRVARRDYLQASAQVLGMKPEELVKALKAGKTLEQLAGAKGMNKDQFADAVVKAIKPLLDKDVDSHRLTRAEADRVVKALQSGRIPWWNGRHTKHAA
jgi:hypothetical protein